MVRATAAAALATRPPAERLTHLPALLADPLRAVRIAAARGLAGLPDEMLSAAQLALRRRGLDEFIAAQQAMADMPSAQINLVLLHADLGNPAAAERHYRRAIAQDRSANAARLGLAGLLAASGAGRRGMGHALIRRRTPKSGGPGLGPVRPEPRWSVLFAPTTPRASRSPSII